MWAPQRDVSRAMTCWPRTSTSSRATRSTAGQSRSGTGRRRLRSGGAVDGRLRRSRACAARRRAGPRLFLAGARAARRRRPKGRPERRDRDASRAGDQAWAPSAPAPPPPERTVEELIRATEALRDRRDSTDFVREFERPLWIVVGSGTLSCPGRGARDRRVGAERAPRGARGAGHFTNVERRNRFNELLGEFLAGL